MQIAYDNLNEETIEIQSLKKHFITELKNNFTKIAFNGASENEETSSYIILNVRFSKEYPMLLFNLDLRGIAVSGGSACQSGSNKGSHVLNAILSDNESVKTSIRFSFSKLNTIEEVDFVINNLKELIK